MASLLRNSVKIGKTRSSETGFAASQIRCFATLPFIVAGNSIVAKVNDVIKVANKYRLVVEALKRFAGYCFWKVFRCLFVWHDSNFYLLYPFSAFFEPVSPRAAQLGIYLLYVGGTYLRKLYRWGKKRNKRRKKKSPSPGRIPTHNLLIYDVCSTAVLPFPRGTSLHFP